MTKASQWAAYVPSLANQAAAQGKKVVIEEWGVGTGDYDSIATQAAVFNNAGVPWVSLLLHFLLDYRQKVRRNHRRHFAD